ncbi:MAG TPA: cation diffusion facilitator family transporter [Acidimicrobiales bacterium]|nr:cation diffusion facilitator family transporter [Acidimicrobiales bacterium]
MGADHRHRDSHSEDHHPEGHVHGHHALTPESDRRYLSITLALFVTFMVFEVTIAFISHSLALLADAGHMLADVGAIAGSLYAMYLAARPETGSHTFGLKRAEILAAAGNAITLLLVAALVTFEAVQRLVHPVAVPGATLIVVAAVGVVVNVLATVTMSRADRRSLNIEGAYKHVVTDLYGFIGTVIAGVVIVTTGFTRADSIASLVVVGLMVKASLGLLRPALHIFLEATPKDIDLEEVRRHLLELPEVAAVHDLHAWTLTSSLPILTAHVVVTDDCISRGEIGRVLDHLQGCLAGHFDVDHSTLQLEAIGHVDHESGGHA